MIAIIHSRRTRSGGFMRSCGALEIAGVSLLRRQVVWLRAAGASCVVVEAAPSATRLLAMGDDVVTMVPACHAIGLRDLALQSGHEPGEPVLCIADNVLCEGDLRGLLLNHASLGALVRYRAPWGVPLAYGSVRILGRQPAPATLIEGEGWAVRIQSPADARLIERTTRCQERSAFAAGPSTERELGSGVYRIVPGRLFEHATYDRIARAAGF